MRLINNMYINVNTHKICDKIQNGSNKLVYYDDGLQFFFILNYLNYWSIII